MTIDMKDPQNSNPELEQNPKRVKHHVHRKLLLQQNHQNEK